MRSNSACASRLEFPGFKAPTAPQPARSPPLVLALVESERLPERRARGGEGEPAGHDAHHFERALVEEHGLSQNVPASTHDILPKRPTQNDDRVIAFDVLGLGERSAQQRLGAQDGVRFGVIVA